MTAEEFLNKKQKEYSKGIGNSFKTNYDLEKERLIEFAKIHVQQALQAATKESFAESSHSNITSKDKLNLEEAKQRAANYMSLKGALEPKQETLEEAAEIYVWGGIYLSEAEKQQTEIAFMAGAQWQQKRMYSEEDMREAFIAGGNSLIEEDDDYGTEYDAYMEQWFNKFKKK